MQSFKSFPCRAIQREAWPCCIGAVSLHGGSSLVGLRAASRWRSNPTRLEKDGLMESIQETPRLPVRMGAGRTWGSDSLARLTKCAHSLQSLVDRRQPTKVSP